jgi:hypothetical protein
MDNNMHVKIVIEMVKELFMKNINNQAELSKLIDKYLIPQESEKKQNAEVSTPRQLRQDMLDKIPTDFWKSPKLVFEPCCGKGGFLIDIIERFMVGLSDLITDDKERYKFIIENCLYFSDINECNIYICKLLIDPNNKYTLNYNLGDTLKLNIKHKWKINGFDAVIGNPPYQSNQNNKGKRGGGDLLWNKFVIKSIDLINKNGYLCYVHPSGWRKPESDKSKYKNLFNLMTKENQMLYLEIHNSKDGLKMFNCGTRYDWYVMEKNKQYKKTIILDEKNILTKLDLTNWDFLPNSNFKEIEKLLHKNKFDKCEIIYSATNYETRKSYVKLNKNEEYKYPLINTTPQSGIRYYYSNINNKGHFGISKIIFGDSGINNCIIDIEGDYGMTQHAMAIKINDLNEGILIKKYIESSAFKELLKSCSWSNFQIDWRLFTYFRKDFYLL